MDLALRLCESRVSAPREAGMFFNWRSNSRALRQLTIMRMHSMKQCVDSLAPILLWMRQLATTLPSILRSAHTLS